MQIASTRRGNLVIVHALPDASGSLPNLITVPRLSAGLELKSAGLVANQAPVALRVRGELIDFEVPDPTVETPTQVIELTYADSVMALDPVSLP